MKIIGSVKEDLAIEKRITITPDIIKKYTDLKFSVLLENNYGEHLGINDQVYKKKGANLCSSAKEVFERSEIILKVNSPSKEEINLIKSQSILIGQFDQFIDKEKINLLVKKGIRIFSLILLPRIARAQSMDVLSSQANLAGYKAVIDSFANFKQFQKINHKQVIEHGVNLHKIAREPISRKKKTFTKHLSIILMNGPLSILVLMILLGVQSVFRVLNLTGI